MNSKLDSDFNQKEAQWYKTVSFIALCYLISSIINILNYQSILHTKLACQKVQF